MIVRRIVPIALQVLAAILSLSAALFGGIALATFGHHADKGLLLAYCIPLVLLVPFFCVSFFRPRLSVGLQLCAAVVFVSADFLVNLHRCGGAHPCASLLRIAFASFLEPITLVPFMIAALQTLTMYTREWEQMSHGIRRTI